MNENEISWPAPAQNGPCMCIQPGRLVLHGGHCCLAGWDPDVTEYPSCHASSWKALKATNEDGPE